jgi:ABC-type branched-subunit amino acid transport system substrate-binding protein
MTEEPKETTDEGSGTKVFSRRDFLKYAGLAGGAIAVAGGLGGLIAACGDSTTTTTAAAATTTTEGGTATTAAAASGLKWRNTTNAFAEATAALTAPDDPYVIGVATDLTGAISFIGTDMRDAILLMVDTINARGGVNGHPLKTIVQDTATDATKTNAALVKLIEQDKVDILIAPCWSVPLPAAQAMAEKAQIPMVYQGPPSAADPTKILKWSFTTVPGEVPLARAELAIATWRGYKAGVLIADAEILFQRTIDQCAIQAPAKGITVDRLTDMFAAGDADMSAQALKIKASAAKINADFIVIASAGAGQDRREPAGHRDLRLRQPRAGQAGQRSTDQDRVAGPQGPHLRPTPRFRQVQAPADRHEKGLRGEIQPAVHNVRRQ